VKHAHTHTPRPLLTHPHYHLRPGVSGAERQFQVVGGARGAGSGPAGELGHGVVGGAYAVDAPILCSTVVRFRLGPTPTSRAGLSSSFSSPLHPDNRQSSEFDEASSVDSALFPLLGRGDGGRLGPGSSGPAAGGVGAEEHGTAQVRTDLRFKDPSLSSAAPSLTACPPLGRLTPSRQSGPPPRPPRPPRPRHHRTAPGQAPAAAAVPSPRRCDCFSIPIYLAPM
jgi:hypothetical protein